LGFTYTTAKRYFVGPRKVTIVGRVAAVYLGTRLKHLVGKRVMIIVEVLEEEENKVKT